jgi:hypothetical protein
VRGSGLNAGSITRGSQMQETSGSPGNSQVGVGIFQRLRNVAGLPTSDVIQNTPADCWGFGESSIEENKVNLGAVTQEIAEMPSHSGIFRIGETHFSEP